MYKKKLQLPEHSPHENVWKNIDNELNNRKLIHNLPQHTPSDNVWKKIEQQQTNHVLKLPQWIKIAATVALIIGVSYIITRTNSSQEELGVTTYSELWIEPTDISHWNPEEDQNIYALIEQKENEFPKVLKSEEYQLLKKEYINLLDSKKQLLNEVTPYNENVELELILTRIEIEKSAIVRSLISFHTT